MIPAKKNAEFNNILIQNKIGCRLTAYFRDSHRIQTCNLLIRSQMLYSVELANLL